MTKPNVFSKLLLYLSISLSVGLASCSPPPFDPGVRDLAVTITDDACKPMKYRVPAEEEINIRLDNQTDGTYSWIFLARPVELPLDAGEMDRVYFAVLIPPGEELAARFITPSLAMEYDVICSRLPHSEEDEIGRIVVVQPPPYTP